MSSFEYFRELYKG
uniref:Uncharacterized protein n=1 Tax=Anguilla anguilla TaxID=7936 RepID=A0A0E9UHR9_ANGAN